MDTWAVVALLAAYLTLLASIYPTETMQHVRSLLALRDMPKVRDNLFRSKFAVPLPQHIRQTRVPLAGLEDNIDRHLSYRCGVHILCLPRSSGKTTAAQHVANEHLAKGAISGVVYIRPSGNETSYTQAITNAVGVDARHMYDAFGSVAAARNASGDSMSWTPVLLIIDDADDMLPVDKDARAMLDSDLVNLACQSWMTKDFMLLMLFRRPEVAKAAWECNGRTKITLFPRLGERSPDAVATDTEMESAVEAQQLDLLPEQRAKLVALAKVARSIGFVVDVAQRIRGLQQTRLPWHMQSLTQEQQSKITHMLETDYAAVAAEHSAEWERWRKDMDDDRQLP